MALEDLIRLNFETRQSRGIPTYHSVEAAKEAGCDVRTLPLHNDDPSGAALMIALAEGAQVIHDAMGGRYAIYAKPVEPVMSPEYQRRPGSLSDPFHPDHYRPARRGPLPDNY